MTSNSGPGYARHPDHKVRLERTAGTVRVVRHGRTIAQTDAAITVHEADYPPVQYLPRDSLQGVTLEPTERRTHCPFKGDASYYTLVQDGQSAANAIWSYEVPFDEVAELKDKIAFYPDQVDEVKVG